MTKILVQTQTELQQCLEAIENSSIIVFDVEAEGLRLYQDHRMIGIAFYCDFNGNSYYIPFNHGHGTFEPSTKTNVNKMKADLTNIQYQELGLVFPQFRWEDVKEALQLVRKDLKS